MILKDFYAFEKKNVGSKLLLLRRKKHFQVVESSTYSLLDEVSRHRTHNNFSASHLEHQQTFILSHPLINWDTQPTNCEINSTSVFEVN